MWRPLIGRLVDAVRPALVDGSRYTHCSYELWHQTKARRRGTRTHGDGGSSQPGGTFGPYPSRGGVHRVNHLPLRRMLGEAKMVNRMKSCVVVAVVGLTVCGGGGSDGAVATSAPKQTSVATTTSELAATSTLQSTTTLASTTTAQPTTTTVPKTGLQQVSECPSVDHLADDDGDGWGQCTLTTIAVDPAVVQLNAEAAGLPEGLTCAIPETIVDSGAASCIAANPDGSEGVWDIRFVSDFTVPEAPTYTETKAAPLTRASCALKHLRTGNSRRIRRTPLGVACTSGPMYFSLTRTPVRASFSLTTARRSTPTTLSFLMQSSGWMVGRTAICSRQSSRTISCRCGL